MKKRILGGIAVLVFAVIIGLNINQNNKDSNKVNDVNLHSVEASASSIGEWWDSKVYDCQNVQVWVYKCMKYKDIPRPDGGWEVGVGKFDPNETVCGMFQEWKSECVGGKTVAHCWDC